MGCDGGTIPRRDELVRTKQKPEQKDKDAENMAKWQHCALSSTKLNHPIVSCELGRLYNKDALIEYLLEKKSSENATHIRGLKDVVVLNLTEKPNYTEKSAENGGEYVDVQDSRYICPVVGLDMNGKYKFCYLRGCGCVLSERALREVRSDVCHKCGKTYNEDDIITINGNEEEINILKEKMITRRAAEKKSKKRKLEVKVKEEPIENGPIASTSSTSVNKDSKISVKTTQSSIEQNKSKKSYSVAKDPNASETFKSIFTTHKSAINRPKGHWVTYNPLYF